MTRHSGGDQTTRRTTFRNVKVVTKKCRRSRCPNRFVIATRGRRRKYCSTACRMAAYRARQRVRVEHRSGNDEWGTPRDLFDHLDERYGPFTVDAAASDANHLCARFWTRADDGLAQGWSGEIVWCNPPYSQARKWIEKAWQEREHTVIVMLLRLSPGTNAWQQWIIPEEYDVHYEVLPGRLKFSGHKNAAPFESAVVVFGAAVKGNQR